MMPYIRRRSIIILGLLTAIVVIVVILFLEGYGNKAGGPIIMFDEAHKPLYSIGSNPALYVGGYSQFAETLRARGYIIKTLKAGEQIDLSRLKGTDVLVIMCGRENYTIAEINSIVRWVNEGGSLLLLGDYDHHPLYIEPIAKAFGIHFEGMNFKKITSLADNTSNVGGNPSYIVFTDANIRHHEVTENISRIEMYSLSSIEAESGTPLIVTSNTTYWLNTGQPAYNRPVMMVVKHGKGRIVVVGDVNLWSDIDFDGDGVPALYDSDNLRLAINTVKWLTGEKYTASNMLGSLTGKVLKPVGITMILAIALLTIYKLIRSFSPRNVNEY